jgi:hypothetical protein
VKSVEDQVKIKGQVNCEEDDEKNQNALLLGVVTNDIASWGIGKCVACNQRNLSEGLVLDDESILNL